MKKIISFNSRPHTEVDRILSHCQSEHNAFQLTTSHGGRLTDAGFTYAISIFQLTTSHGGRPFHFQRNGAQKGPFNSRPHTEVDLPEDGSRVLAVIFQLTTSHGGRQAFLNFAVQAEKLSTHDLTRRSTAVICGRRWRGRSFNSRPHTEVDNSEDFEDDGEETFQLTTSHGGRHTM